MESPHKLCALAVVVLLAFKVSAATLHVDLNSTNPVPPYADWSTAATNIQDAVDASTNGDLILVTNGVYQTAGRTAPDGFLTSVVVTNAVSLQSVNGASVTMINGNQTIRCVYLTNGTMLTGFTLTNGNAGYGGGVFCTSTNALVANCLIVSNSASYGGGSHLGTLTNCTITGNFVATNGYGGGSIGSVLINCLVNGNYAWSSMNDGGIGLHGGGGGCVCTFNNCVIEGNSASDGGGVLSGTLNNCLLTGNSASYGGAVAAIASEVPPTVLNNCTIYGNSASVQGGGLLSVGQAGPSYMSLTNCIVYGNTAPSGSNYIFAWPVEMTFDHCCTAPLLTNGVGNITNDPALVDPTGGDFHLQSNSPCINSGNIAHVVYITDLDGQSRVVVGTVDIGAYEYQTPTSIISYVWLQQYGLPITTNTDIADPDNDGMNNYQEWIAGTDPTNSLSLLEMLNPVPTNNPAGLVLSWQSVSNITYFLQSSTNLGMQPAFSTIQSNIVGQPDMTSYLDTNAVGNGPFFYRVGVQQ